MIEMPKKIVKILCQSDVVKSRPNLEVSTLYHIFCRGTFVKNFSLGALRAATLFSCQFYLVFLTLALDTVSPERYLWKKLATANREMMISPNLCSEWKKSICW